MDDVKHLANYGQLGIPQEIFYAISIKNNKVISSHRPVNICVGNSSGLIRDRNQIEIRDFLGIFFSFCTSIVY